MNCNSSNKNRTVITMFMTGKFFEMSELDRYIGSLGKGYVIK